MVKQIFSLDELIKNADIRSFRGRLVNIRKINDEQERGTVIDFIGACNHPYLDCGFILSGERHISFESIKTIEVEF